jgi:phage-related protein
MATRDENGQRQVKRVSLPSGKTIEVIYFQDPGQELQAPSEQRSEQQDLHICPACDSTLAYPTHWTEANQAEWEVTLRCPNCEWSGTGVFEQDVVERFDEELDRGTEALVRDLKRLMQANMEDEIERFVSALQAGHIVPEDF